MAFTRRIPAFLLTLPLLLAALGTGCSREVIDVQNPYVLNRSEYDAIFAATKDALHAQGFKLDRVDYRFGTITTKPLTSPTAMEPWHDQNTTFSQAAESTLNNQRRLVTVTLEGFYKQSRPGATNITIKPGDALPNTITAGSSDPRLDKTPDKSAEKAAATGATGTSTPAAPVPVATTAPAPETVEPLIASTQPAEKKQPYDGYVLRIAVFVERLQTPERRLGGSSSSRRMFDELTSAPAELRERGISGPYWLSVGRDPYFENRLIASVVRLSVRK